jgi:hypothetical protein
LANSGHMWESKSPIPYLEETEAWGGIAPYGNRQHARDG